MIQILGDKPFDEISARLQRFRMRLAKFDYNMKFVQGVPHLMTQIVVIEDNPQNARMAEKLLKHAGYEVTVPLKELSGSDNHLTMVFRVYPEHKSEESAYFSQRWTVFPVTWISFNQ